MATGRRWLLLRSGSRLVAAPLAQVALLSSAEEAPPGKGDGVQAGEPVVLSRSLWGEEEPSPDVTVRVRALGGSGRVCVGAVEEISEEQEMIPLPALLRRAVSDAAPLVGAILWRGRPVPVVDLARVIAGRSAEGVWHDHVL